MHAIRIAHTGGPEVLEWKEIDDPTPDADELLVEVAAAGVNFIDTYHRTGLYPMENPFTPGIEGAGHVLAVGADATGFSIGDRVAWSNSLGSYAEKITVRHSRAVLVPEEVELEQAGAVLLQGMTAHYLVLETFPLKERHRCLIHAGAGGVGRLLIQLAKRLGAVVFTTVGSDEKAEVARSAGADHVINYQEQDFVEAVRRLGKSEKPLDVVFDGVGKSVFLPSLDLLRKRGMMVTFGNASGAPDPIAPLDLMRKGSLFLTRPSLVDHVATRTELEQRATEVFEWIAEGTLEVYIGHRLQLSQAAEAHRSLEERKTTGKVLLLP